YQARGFGWDLARVFGKGSSARTFGHGGSTGTLAWMDPEKDLSFVLLTTKPAGVSGKTLLFPVSHIISQSSLETFRSSSSPPRPCVPHRAILRSTGSMPRAARPR